MPRRVKGKIVGVGQPTLLGETFPVFCVRVPTGVTGRNQYIPFHGRFIVRIGGRRNEFEDLPVCISHARMHGVGLPRLTFGVFR